MLHALFFFSTLLFFGASQTAPITVPVRYFTPTLTKADNFIGYYKISICKQSPSAPFATLAINLPNNPTWVEGKGWLLAEVSSDANSWNNATVLAANYKWDNNVGVPLPNGTISWKYDPTKIKNDLMFLRIKSNQEITVDFTIEFAFTPTLSTNFKGQFDTRTFNQPNRPADATLQPLSQYVRLEGYSTVQNFLYQYIEFAFCTQELPNNASEPWGAHVTVAADKKHPHSAFNLYLCALDVGTSRCRPNSVYVHGVDDSSSAVVDATITRSSTVTIENGIIALVEGEGGNRDQMNYFDLTAVYVKPPAKN